MYRWNSDYERKVSCSPYDSSNETLEGKNYERMVSLFGLWDYGKVVPHLLIAVYRKDVEKCIQLIKEVLVESQKPWKMVESPLYYRYANTVQGKSFSGVGNNFVRALATEIENKEEYEFLKGNKELEAIFSQYLK